MKSREQWIQEQRRAEEIYPQVRDELLRIPGVVDVAVAMKETGGALIEDVAFRVYVEEKLPEAALPPEHVIPKMIQGIKTDVIRKRVQKPLIGFNDEDDWRNYPTKVGGIYIGSEDGGGNGTLGCFCKRTTDNAVVFLSNHHVLFSGSAAIGSKVGQPDHKKSCCCTCNEIGEVVDGQAGALDCAIAKLNGDVPFFTKIKTIKKGDGTVEANGFISGNAAAVMNDEVWKIGARTGLTRGFISQTTPDVEVTPVPPFLRVADHGDSGSVVVRRLSGDVVGLLKSIDIATETFGYATPIAPVLAAMHITITPTDTTQNFNVARSDEEDAFFGGRVTDSAFVEFAERLRATDAGQQLLGLVETHRRECLRLVNQHRPVTVAWQRSQGPSFLAAIARSMKDPAYRIPDALEGISRDDAVTRIRHAFTTHGSDALRADIAVHGDPLVHAFITADTAEALIRDWESSAAVLAGETR